VQTFSGWTLRTKSIHPRLSIRSSPTDHVFVAASPRGTRLFSNESGLRVLYPPSDAYMNGTIQVDAHEIFYEVHGKAMDDTSTETPLTCLFLHGGPAAGCTPTHARFFDPERYRIVLLDQRGSGKSKPLGETKNNTLGHLVQDCETLRQELGIRRWDVILGGSWGVTLALAYAQTFPRSVAAMILRGVCLLRTCEVDYLFSSKGGAAKRNPQAWREFEQAVNIDQKASSQDPRSALHAYYERLMGNDINARWNAARSWMRWEFSATVSHKLSVAVNTSDGNTTMVALKNHATSPVAVYKKEKGWFYQDAWGKLLSDEEKQRLEILPESQSVWNLRLGIEEEEEDVNSLQRAAITQPRTVPVKGANNESADSSGHSTIPAQCLMTCYYSTNNLFAMDNLNLLDPTRMDRIRMIPCIAVQGGMDRVCPPDTALELRTAYPGLELRIPMNAGHSMYDPSITHELVQATDYFADLFLPREEEVSS
jgi:proline iminopeptidase